MSLRKGLYIEVHAAAKPQPLLIRASEIKAVIGPDDSFPATQLYSRILLYGNPGRVISVTDPFEAIVEALGGQP